jgi:hypothetical protein
MYTFGNLPPYLKKPVTIFKLIKFLDKIFYFLTSLVIEDMLFVILLVLCDLAHDIEGIIGFFNISYLWDLINNSSGIPE